MGRGKSGVYELYQALRYLFSFYSHLIPDISPLSMNYIYLDLDPSVKRRPRFRRTGQNVATYSDPKDVAFKKAVQLMAKYQIDYPLDGPLRCELVFFIKRPKTVRAKYPTSQRSGDVDNLAKAVLDSLNPSNGFGGAYNDDSQIVSLTCSKYYRDVSGIEIKIYSLN